MAGFEPARACYGPTDFKSVNLPRKDPMLPFRCQSCGLLSIYTTIASLSSVSTLGGQKFSLSIFVTRWRDG